MPCPVVYQILDEMDIPFLVRVRPIDEKSLGDRCEGSSPDKLVRMLANAKADAFLHDLPEAQRNILDDGEPKIISNDEQNDSDDKESEKRQPVLPSPVSPGGYIILAADQVVSHRNHILEKPRSLDEARSFVKGYADSPPSTVGAICLLHLPSRERVEGVHSATIHFSKGVAGGGVGDDLISRLVAAGAPVQDCAGGLMVEHPLVREFIVGIDGTEDSVMGLSKKLVWDLLAELREKITKTKDF